MLDLEALGRRVAALREDEKRWSQARLGMEMRSHMSDGWVSLVEAGKVPNLSLAMIHELADALGVDAEHLIGTQAERLSSLGVRFRKFDGRLSEESIRAIEAMAERLAAADEALGQDASQA